MHLPVVVIGAGPAGLATSHHLGAAGIDHVVLERREVASSWRTERWDSLRLLTPNWMCQLPGWGYRGDDPDGFMTAAEVVGFLDGYRRSFDPPVLAPVEVRDVRRAADGFTVTTDVGTWRADAVVVATGASSHPRVPALATELPTRLQQLPALAYRRPDQVAGDGDVLVVGASASGVQIAEELLRHGRRVTVAVGDHIRLPRSYRGRDIYWWLTAIGQLDERFDEVDDLDRARRHASVQLVGSPDQHTLDLEVLRRRGARLVGRLAGVRDGRALCSGGLSALVTNADLKQDRLLERIDAFVRTAGLDSDVGPPARPVRTRLDTPPTDLDLAGFSSVIWATGYRARSPWLDPAALDRRGAVAHDGGVGRLPGLYVLGLPFLRRRRSNLIAGVGADAADLHVHLRAHLDGQARPRPTSAGARLTR
jgi:putative flavoprotein involved in K+ transport